MKDRTAVSILMALVLIIFGIAAWFSPRAAACDEVHEPVKTEKTVGERGLRVPGGRIIARIYWDKEKADTPKDVSSSAVQLTRERQELPESQPPQGQ